MYPSLQVSGQTSLVSMVFSCLCCCQKSKFIELTFRNRFFRLYQKDKSFKYYVKFTQASNQCKRVLETSKLAHGNKTKEPITSQKLGSLDFQWIANSVLNKGKSAIPSLFNIPEVLSSAFDKRKLFAESFSKDSNHDDSLYLFSLLELIWNCITFL